MARGRHVVLGGTFDHLHAGHHALLATAFARGTSVSIGLTTARYLAEHPKPHGARVQPYATRRRALVRWLERTFPGRTWTVVPLENRFGRSVEAGFDLLIVSADTRLGARAVNAERRRLGRPPLPTEVVPVVLADDLDPVSSRRIREGVIDAGGRRRAPIAVGVAVTDPGDLPPVERAVRRAFRSARVVPTTLRTVASRARSPRRAMRRAGRRRDLGLAVLRRPGRSEVRLAFGSARVEIAPRTVPAGTPGALHRAVLDLLRPDLRRKG